MGITVVNFTSNQKEIISDLKQSVNIISNR